MGNYYSPPKRVGQNPFTRSGAPPPKLVIRKDKDMPMHRVNDPMSLQLHMADERVRTAGLSKAEREWREKWVHDQSMHPDEPIHVDAVHRQLNPIRVLYRWPMDKLYKHFLRPTFGNYWATIIRVYVPKFFWFFLTFEFFYYVWKYESKSWQKRIGFSTTNRPERYALVKDHDEETLKLGLTDYSRSDYFDKEFYQRIKTANIDFGPPKRPWSLLMLSPRKYRLLVSGRALSPEFWQLSSVSSIPSNSHKTGLNSKADVKAPESNTLWLNLPSNEEEDVRTRVRRSFFGTYVALLFPAATFALGCWQWKRHKWKTELIEKLKIATKTAPVEFPVDNLSAIDDMEFRKVHVRGHYLFDRQFVIRWRCRLDPANTGTSNSEKYGAYVITPMRLEGTNVTIMVNRGWVPNENIESELKKGKQMRESELKDLNAVVRSAEKGSPFVKNDPEKGIWAFKDLEEMARQSDAVPIIVDADFESTEKDGPIGGQTIVVLRNQHYSYMVQWFGLTVGVLGMWALRFL
ncbi:hypothetical protein niasHS_014728 [Heterodera schachtii]|uniref:SURF1-like protein n=1 Tax=Heterodera schachtii TaxID=97005 RepID=A0ABD2III9_HETSC